MSTREKTITEFMIEEQRRFPEATGDFTALLNYVRLACKRISFIVGAGPSPERMARRNRPTCRARRKCNLDVMSNDIFLRTSEYGGHLAGMVSEELEEPYQIPPEYPRGKYLLAFDPLDGSSNIDINAPVGSIFSVLKAPRGMQAAGGRGFSAARIAAAMRGVCHLRRHHHAGAHRRARRARIHPGSRLRRIHIDAPEHDHPAMKPTSSPSMRPTRDSGNRRSNAM